MLILSGPVASPSHLRIGHPERPDRIQSVMSGVDDLHLGQELRIVQPRLATREEITRVHLGSYLEELAAFTRSGGGDLDPDTYATRASWTSAHLAAGAGLTAIEELIRTGAGVGLVVARPPGHHALPDRAMGFCLLNNIAISAAKLASAGERVLIVDWDAHHGNGTQEIFWNDRRVLYVSTHQWPLFPGTGRASEVGGPEAIGYTINLPIGLRATGDLAYCAIDEVALEAIETFGPSWVLVSAGFDAHRDDPLTDLGFSSGDFARLARVVAGFAPRDGRLVLFLEGGYDESALRACTAATVGSLLGVDVETEPTTTGVDVKEAIRHLRETRTAAIDKRRKMAHFSDAHND